MGLHDDYTQNPAESKVCPYCAERINHRAKLCPRCRQWLTLRSIRNPAVAAWVYGIPHLALYGLLGFFILAKLDAIFNPKPDYSELPNALAIVDSHMNFADTANGLRIYITGILTNRSNVAWRSVEFECRFFDANGGLVDADHPHAGVTIEAHDDTAFRTIVTPSRSTNLYASYRIVVTTARNTKGIW